MTPVAKIVGLAFTVSFLPAAAGVLVSYYGLHTKYLFPGALIGCFWGASVVGYICYRMGRRAAR